MFFVMDLLSASISTVCYCIVAIVMWRVQYTNLHLRLDSVPGNALDGFSSYSVFMNMSLYFNIAIYLGVMLYLCYMCFSARLPDRYAVSRHDLLGAAFLSPQR